MLLSVTRNRRKPGVSIVSFRAADANFCFVIYIYVCVPTRRNVESWLLSAGEASERAGETKRSGAEGNSIEIIV